MPWPRPAWFTALAEAVVTVSWRLVDVPRPGGRKISKKSGFGEGAATTFTTDTSERFPHKKVERSNVNYF